jgi:capsular exopolysaccharide synthesis family protein
MSRVYEALRRAEDQTLVEEHSTNERSPSAEAVRRIDASRNQTYLDPAVVGRLQSKPVCSKGEQRDQQRVSLSGSPHSDDANADRESSLSPLTLPADRRPRGPLLVIGHTEYPEVAEQFHRLSLSVQNWAAENEKRIFTIMSALSQDGKSFVAVNLAASLAMGGSRVILVDGDLRQPVLHHSFHMVAAKGLIGYIRREVEFGECLQATSIPGLMLVPAGGTSYAPSELLASPRMRDFIREVRSANPAHYLIIDSPASSLVPEPQILSRLGDASLVVVAANRTPRELVKQTIEITRGIPVVGIVLNRFEAPYSAIAHYPDRYAQRPDSKITMSSPMRSMKGRETNDHGKIRSLIARLNVWIRTNSLYVR